MDDRTAEVVNWLSRGRTSALVAPALRAATAPGARRSMERARDMAAVAQQMDTERLRRIVDELRDDRAFRTGVAMAGGRVRDAVESTDPRRRGRRRMMMVLLAALAGVGVVLWRRMGTGTHADEQGPSSNGSSPHQQTAPFSVHSG